MNAREQIAEALRPVLLERIALDRADALMPLVDRLCAEAAAEALESAALDWPPTWAASPSDYLRDRAARLRAEDEAS